MKSIQGKHLRRVVFVTFVTVIAAALATVSTAASAVEARTQTDYGLVFMQRDDGCTHEELWTGLNETSTASVAPGSAWSEPSAIAWAWYSSTNQCTSEETTVYGAAALAPGQYEMAKLGDLRFEAHLELFEVESSDRPPFLLSGPSGVTTDLWGTVHIDLVFTQEGPVHMFNAMNGILLPPPRGTFIGAPGQRVAWQYTGASLTGSVSGDVSFDLDSIVFAEIGSFTTIEAGSALLALRAISSH